MSQTAIQTTLSAETEAGWMARLFARLITLYQRHISPYKGFQFAYRVLHGGDSCSQYVKRMVLQQGVWNIFSTARKRFSECRYAKEALIRSRSNQSADSPNTSAEESPKKRRWFSHPLFEFADLPFDCCCSASAAAAASGANAAEGGAEGAAGAADASAEIASGGAKPLPVGRKRLQAVRAVAWKPSPSTAAAERSLARCDDTPGNVPRAPARK